MLPWVPTDRAPAAAWAPARAVVSAPGTGNGWGPGTGGNAGGGLFRIGGGVSAPVPIVSPEAEFSDEARRAKYQGVCLVSLIVDAQGNPQNPRVIRALGMGLDEKALEAVRKYKFKPAMKDGQDPRAGDDHHRGQLPALLSQVAIKLSQCRVQKLDVLVLASRLPLSRVHSHHEPPSAGPVWISHRL